MKIIRVTYFALATLISVASCSKEAMEPDVIDWADGKIYIKPSLSDVATSRAQDLTLDKLETFQVTCFNTADRDKDTQGYISPYFDNITFIRKANGTYESLASGETCNWPSNNGFLRFFAFSPSLAIMPHGNSALDGSDITKYFNTINTSTEVQTNVSVEYSLGTIRINPDISRQFDFVTAEASGERWKDFSGYVELAFSHKLSQVEIRAFGEHEGVYDFNIAGVRIGNPVVEGTYIFADDTNPGKAGNWEFPEKAIKDKVEYLFQPGDRIYNITSTEHNNQESASSIMGNGGCAMVIPTKNDKWEGLDDPNISDTPYTTDKMYFSILMRVCERETGKIIYPYPGNKLGMDVISYAVDSTGTIITQLYTGEQEGTYFTDEALLHSYEPQEGEEIIEFGWAAVPVDVDWSAGKKYIYTLNYTEGIGIHDPADPNPGNPIGGQSNIEWGVKVEGWSYAEKDDNFEPDLTVP